MRRLILLAALLIAAPAFAGNDLFEMHDMRFKLMHASPNIEEWSWQIGITNQADIQRICKVNVEFLDAEGFITLRDSETVSVGAYGTITARGDRVTRTPSGIDTANFSVSCEIVR